MEGNERTVKVKKNILGSFVNKGVSIILSFILLPITLGYVSSELYGIWLTLSSIVAWLNIMDIGFSLGLKNKLAEAIALNQWERGRQLVSTTYCIMIMIFVPLAVMLEFVIPHINWSVLLNVSEQYNDDIIRVMYVLVAFFAVHMILGVLTAVIAAFQKVALSGTLGVIGHALALLTIFVFTKTLPPSLLYLSFAYTMMPLIVLLIASVVLFSGKFKKVSPKLSSFKKSQIGDLFNMGWKFFVIQLQVIVMFQTTNILISHVSSPESVTAYNISYKYITIAMMIFNIIVVPLWPAFTDAFTKGDYKWMNNIYSKMSKLCLLTMVGVLLLLIISPLVYKLWIGDKTTIPFSMTLTVALYTIINCWDSLQVNMINGTGRINLQLYVTLIGLVAQIPLAYFLGSLIGAEGVVLSQTIIVSIYCVFMTIQIRKLIAQTAAGVWAK